MIGKFQYKPYVLFVVKVVERGRTQRYRVLWNLKGGRVREGLGGDPRNVVNKPLPVNTEVVYSPDWSPIIVLYLHMFL